ncbi:MAG: phosphate/phosphite/phosphonate ABC transporter substrate-binding protein, partial [Rubrobacter sp.]
MKGFLRPFALGMGLLVGLAVVAGCGGGEESASAQGGQMPDELVMGIIPAEDNQEMVRLFQPVADYMGEELGTEIELYTATDYSGIIEAMRSGNVDLAWYGPLSYVLANEVADAEAIAVQTTEEGVKDPSYHSLMITQADSGITEIEDLEGKSFAFVDPASTSGNLFPRKAFDEAGMDPEKDLAESTYAGGHDASALAVTNGTVDGAAVADTTFDLMVEEGTINESEFR